MSKAMSSLKRVLYFVIILIGTMVTGISAGAAGVDHWIVVFDPEVVNEAAQDAIIKGTGGSMVKDLPLISGKAVILPEQAIKALSKKAGVVRIDPDILLSICPKPGTGDNAVPIAQPLQTLPWGIDRIDAEVSLKTYNATGAGVKVAVLDTGIDTGHPDLIVAGGINIIGSRKNYKDDNGHGTHVAGTIAALDNEIGVVGVAPSASLYSVKVFDSNGGGRISDTIAGIDWCIKNRMNVINMSFRATLSYQSLHDAIKKAAAAGIIQVAAAGNDSGPVGYPAAYPETIAVSAIGKDGFASFSNYGPEVDYAAPGVGILSTVPGGKYSSWSGTSMATPHVTGVVAIMLQMRQQGLKGEWLSDLTSEQQGNGVIDAEDTVNGNASPIGNNCPTSILAPKYSIDKLTTTWAGIKIHDR